MDEKFKPIRFDKRFVDLRKYQDVFYRYLVYGWFRGKVYLYIGMTTRGRHRFFSHHVIKNFLKTDYIDIWLCKDGAEASELEKKLINEHHPKLNKRLNQDRWKNYEYRKVPLKKVVHETYEVIPLPNSEYTGSSVIKKEKTRLKKEREDLRKLDPDEIRLLFTRCQNKDDYEYLLSLIK